MKRWLYVIDENGKEVPGSRRSIDHCRDWQERNAVEGELRRQMGDDCEIRDSILDRK